MKPSFSLIALIGIVLAVPSARSEDILTATGPATATVSADNAYLSARDPILCGVSPKGKDLISASAALSKEVESLDLLLEALSPGQNKMLEKIINQGSVEDLIAIEGIAEGRAKIIIAERPYREVKELMLIKGFGYATVASVIMHGSNLKP